MKRTEKDLTFAAHLANAIQYHQTMLNDGVRNRLIADAITRNVTSETRFLDVGAGTGVWAILAAQLGAKRVVAVEIEECLIPIIYKQAQENGVSDRIELIEGRSNDVKIKGKFDVIVSELFGGSAFNKFTMESFVDLRTRFLAPGGVLIPERLELLAVPVHIPGPVDGFPAELPLSYSFFRSLKLNFGRTLAFADHGRITQLAEPKVLIDVDLQTAGTEIPLKDLTVCWEVADLCRANAILVFNRSTFFDRIVMDGFSSQSWKSTAYEFVPSERKTGQLQFRISLDENQGNWSVTFPDSTDKPQNFAPIFASASVRMAQAAAPYRKYSHKKTKKKGK
jgi:SAM-dependent methyltransferase